MIYSPCRYWKVHPLTGYIPLGFCKTRTCTCQNPHPWMRVQVLTGTGAGCLGKPQGSPWHSLCQTLWWKRSGFKARKCHSHRYASSLVRLDFIGHKLTLILFPEMWSAGTISRSEAVPPLDFQTMRQNVNESQRKGFSFWFLSHKFIVLLIQN